MAPVTWQEQAGPCVCAGSEGDIDGSGRWFICSAPRDLCARHAGGCARGLWERADPLLGTRRDAVLELKRVSPE